MPAHEDRTLFEFLVLGGTQAGVSWETILKKRQNYREAFDGSDATKVTRYDRRQMHAHTLQAASEDDSP
ncbi:MAG: DNA-3-methyladenine glycosylase I [Candidatus Sulfotelmatobacter sp.]